VKDKNKEYPMWISMKLRSYKKMLLIFFISGIVAGFSLGCLITTLIKIGGK
jgi:hypothetical protein